MKSHNSKASTKSQSKDSTKAPSNSSSPQSSAKITSQKNFNNKSELKSSESKKSESKTNFGKKSETKAVSSQTLAAKFLISAVEPKDYPKADRPEVAIAGRSNAGKSSLLNAMTGAKIAKVSQTPGKTRLLNFFDVGKAYRIVDMPGYGYASRSGDEMRDWSKMIEMYLGTRGNLFGVVLVMDIRREWEDHEEILKRFCLKINIPMIVVLTKADKCNKSELKQYTERLMDQSAVEKIFVTSSFKKEGVADLEKFIFEVWGKPGLRTIQDQKKISAKQENQSKQNNQQVKESAIEQQKKQWENNYSQDEYLSEDEYSEEDDFYSKDED